MELPFLDAEAVFRALSFAEAVDTLERTLVGGLDPAAAVDRSIVDVAHGQLLLMPAETATATGVKLATVAPGNAVHRLPRIQALYVLLDHETLSPLALLDGTALTTLRTPAVSAVAVRHLADPGASRLVVFGSGPQAWGHVEAVRAVRPLESVVVVGRDRARIEALVDRIALAGLPAEAGTPEAVGKADVVVCATTAAEPVFDSALLAPDACVVAVGSHEPDRRELDASLVARAAVEGGLVVESAATALREAGDVVMAVEEGVLHPAELVDLASVVGRERRGGLSAFKSVGMGWQDLAVAEAVLDGWSG
jgi:ornithine cyclodeaminase